MKPEILLYFIRKKPQVFFLLPRFVFPAGKTKHFPSSLLIHRHGRAPWKKGGVWGDNFRGRMRNTLQTFLSRGAEVNASTSGAHSHKDNNGACSYRLLGLSVYLGLTSPQSSSSIDPALLPHTFSSEDLPTPLQSEGLISPPDKSVST